MRRSTLRGRTILRVVEVEQGQELLRPKKVGYKWGRTRSRVKAERFQESPFTLQLA